MAMKAGVPKDINAYLAALPADQRATLAKVRRAIKAAAPSAVESISYGMPTYKLGGRPLIYFAAAKAHLGLYGTSKGTIRFTPEKPVSDAQVTKLVKERIAAIKRR